MGLVNKALLGMGSVGLFVYAFRNNVNLTNPEETVGSMGSYMGGEEMLAEDDAMGDEEMVAGGGDEEMWDFDLA